VGTPCFAGASRPTPRPSGTTSSSRSARSRAWPNSNELVVTHGNGPPTKPVGPVYDHAVASRLADERGWAVARDGDGWRRVVPEPLRIVELGAIRLLVDAGAIVVCVGGGGVPVVSNGDGALHGVEAVVDKDLAGALLARALGADALLLLTDVSAVELDHGTPEARPLRHATPDELRDLDLAAGSMGPKAEAAARFVESSGGMAAIGALEDAVAMLVGDAGTHVRPSG
jgi:carbamate kinase